VSLRIQGAALAAFLLAFSLIFGMNGWVFAKNLGKMQRWMVYYGDELPPEAFYDYDLIVMDSNAHPLLSPLNDRGKTVLGYLSLGEVEKHRPWYADVRREGLLLMESPHWPDSFFVDMRDLRWTNRVLTELIPRILFQGFDGVFLDTLDNPAELERMEPERYKGMTDAAVHLVRAIRRHYPGIKIMLNRAYEILPQVGDVVDMELGESVYSDYDFEHKNYRRVPEALYRRQVGILQDAQARFAHLQIYTLDYWDPEDKEGIQLIYKEQADNGFSPLVSTIELDRIIRLPQQ